MSSITMAKLGFNKSISIVPYMDIIKLQKTLSKMSHTEEDAFSELIDNSYDAGANKINIFFEEKYYVIADNGSGMNEEEVMNSCTFSSKTSDQSVIGYFGCGGTASANVLSNYKKILTKKENTFIVAEHNLSANSMEEMKIKFFEPTDEDKQLFEKFCSGSETGTCIILYDVKSKFTRKGDLKNALIKHCARVFRKLIDSGTQITINYDDKATLIKSYDPLFYNDTSKTISNFLRKETIEVNGEVVEIRMVALNSDSFEKSDSTSPSPERQGIYFVRGGREIEHRRNYTGLWNNHSTLNLGRIEINFSRSLDEEFGVDMAKNRVNLSQSLKDKISSIITPWINEIKKYAQQKISSNNVELKQANDTFNKNIINKAASIGIPKIKSINGEKTPRNDGNKKGTIEKKGTNITRNNKKQIWDVPEWIEVSDINNDKPYWFDEGLITINKSTKFIQEFLINADKKLQDYIRKQLITEYFCMRTYEFDTDEENIVTSYRNKYRDMLVNIYKHID